MSGIYIQQRIARGSVTVSSSRLTVRLLELCLLFQMPCWQAVEHKSNHSWLFHQKSP